MLSGPLKTPTVASRDPWIPHAARIRAIQREAPGISTYTLELEDPQARNQFRFQPGQFNMLYLPGIGECAISISSSADEPETLHHTIRVVGNVTQAISRMRPGEQVMVRGPFGAGWPVELCKNCDIVIAAGGVGLAPLRPVIYHLLRRRAEWGRLILLYGARSPGDLLYTAEYAGWRAGGVEMAVTVDLGDENWQGQIGVVPALLTRLHLDASRTRVFTCGPEVMMRFVIFETIGQKVAAEHIFLSMERNMNCALGHCGHCQFGPTFVCKDGPVFSYRKLEPFLHVEEF